MAGYSRNVDDNFDARIPGVRVVEIGGEQSTPFNQAVVVEPYSLIDLSGVYPLSELRDLQDTSGTGSIAQSSLGEYRLHHATGGDYASLLSSRRGRYQPGFDAEVGIGVRLEGVMGNSTSRAEWGYWEYETGTNTIENGMMFGLDTTGMYVRVVRDSTEVHKVYQDDWNLGGTRNINPFDGKGRIYQIAHTYYGYGGIRFKVFESTSGKPKADNPTVHTYAPEDETSIGNPNLHIAAEVRSSSGGDDFSVYVSGRKYHILGRYDPQWRLGSETAQMSTSTSIAPVLTFRKKAGVFRPITIRPYDMDVIASGANVIVSVHVNSDITGGTAPSYGALTNQPADETCLEVDTSATAIDTSTGSKVFEMSAVAGSGAQSLESSTGILPMDIPDQGTITFAARTLSGSGSVTVSARILEEW